MNDDERLGRLLRAAFPPPEAQEPGRDLWPLVLERSRASRGWSWMDLGLAAVMAAALLVNPRLFLMLVYHL